MRISAAALHYFRSAPYPLKQPKNANRRTDCGENLLSIQVANYLREKTLTGKCKGTWTKIAHETSGKSQAYGNLMRNMGKLAGVPDFIFTHQGKALWLELKNGKSGKLLPDQKFFQSWCDETKSPYAVAFSFEEAIKVIEKAGITTA